MFASIGYIVILNGPFAEIFSAQAMLDFPQMKRKRLSD
jgi:hypothetical protein